MQVLIRQALAASLGLAAAHAGAQSSVSISGTVDVSIRQVRNQGLGTVTSQASGANSTSKLVLRGQEDLGDGLSLVAELNNLSNRRYAPYGQMPGAERSINLFVTKKF